MRLICPSCGATHSAEAWESDVNARQCIRVIGELPTEVSRRALAYLALFRSPNRGLRWSTALRLLVELQRIVKEPYIQWEGKVARPNVSQAWALAMERVIEHPPKRLPLKSHGYLRSVAYEIADELDRAVEKKRIEAERTGKIRPACRDSLGAGRYPEREERIYGTEPDRISSEEMRVIRERNFRRKEPR